MQQGHRKNQEGKPMPDVRQKEQAREKNQSGESRDAPWAGAGTEEDPYRIQTGADLKSLYKYVKQKDFQGEFFRQEAEIDLSAALPGGTREGQDLAGEPDSTWNPIGDMGHKFNGTYTGRGSDGILHKITGLSIVLQAGSTQYCGLFGCLGAQACVRELGIEEAKLYISVPLARAGVIAGVNYGVISDCYASIGNGTAKDVSGFGGIVGIHEKGMITGCFVSGDLRGEGSTGAVGGIAGQNGAKIMSCYYNGTLAGEKESCIGGITGNFGDIGKNISEAGVSCCYSLARIQGESGHAGGISGVEPPAGIAVENCYYLKSYVKNGNAAGTGKDLREMLGDAFLGELNSQGEDTFYRPESQYDEATAKRYDFTPALCVFSKDPGQGERLGLLRESTSAVELESMDITMTEESDEQAEFSWKASNASKCILRCEGEEAQELPTEIKKRRLGVGAGDDIKGELAIQNPYMKCDAAQAFSQHKPVFITGFTVKRRNAKIQRLPGDIGDGFLSLAEVDSTDRAEDYQVSNKNPPPVYRDAYTCCWEVKRAREKGITISSGNQTFSDIEPDRKTWDYESTSSSAKLTAYGKDGEAREKTAEA